MSERKKRDFLLRGGIDFFPQPALYSDMQLSHIFIEIMEGRGNHGAFLRAFAETWARADDLNMAILRAAAIALVAKYDLGKYLDNFGVKP